jgi:hypothetical protein
MPEDRAKQLAGYAPSTKPSAIKPYKIAVQEIRERLQQVAGVTLADQIAWYAQASSDPSNATSDSISARKQIDKLLGYEAPQKVEVNERREIVSAVSIFRNFSETTGLNPRQLKIALANHKHFSSAPVKEIEYIEENPPTLIEDLL